ncbi:hypothetical protein, partial [Streptomyces sp. WAC06614]|uniref:hypothetical protein n=1 Tax=Streptomyces sp. WAC06614 TaxID=2487416 RepID=UPI00163C3087
GGGDPGSVNGTGTGGPTGRAETTSGAQDDGGGPRPDGGTADRGTQPARQNGSSTGADKNVRAAGSGAGATAQATARTFTAVAGPKCGTSDTGYTTYGWYTQGSTGWKPYDKGGYGGAGCNGTGYHAVPMSGHTGSDDGNSVVWKFDTHFARGASCRVHVHVPANNDVQAVGGSPTYYTVQKSFEPGNGTVGSFSIKQVAHQGSWVDAGSFNVDGARFAVMLHTRGQDWSGSRQTHAHHAAGAVRVTCTEA